MNDHFKHGLEAAAGVQRLLKESVLTGTELERLVMETRESNIQLKRIADALEKLLLR